MDKNSKIHELKKVVEVTKCHLHTNKKTRKPGTNFKSDVRELCGKISQLGSE